MGGGMRRMFFAASQFNEPINDWDVAGVSSMYKMFNNAIQFNQPINTWNVAQVETMHGMFADARDFNQPLDEWDVSGVTSMMYMFTNAHNFSQPLDDWDVAEVSTMYDMFNNAYSFNQCISSWAEKTTQEVNTIGMFYYTDCPIQDYSDPNNNGPWCQGVEDRCGVPEACFNSAEFDCSKHSVGLKKRKCFKNIQNKWGSGKKFKDVCPLLCKPHLCTCVDSVESISIKDGGESEVTCDDINDMGAQSQERKSVCKKRTINGFTVKSVCPNACQNTRNCVTDPTPNPTLKPTLGGLFD